MPGEFFMPKRSKQSTKEEAAAPKIDAETLRANMTRALVVYANRKQWPACSRRACRRQRRCTADMTCANQRPARDLTPEQQAAVIGHLYRALKRRMATGGKAG